MDRLGAAPVQTRARSGHPTLELDREHDLGTRGKRRETLTDIKSKRLRSGLTTTETQTQRRTETLTAEEERVVRMLHGLGEPDDGTLAQKKSSDPEVNAQLQLLEAALLAELHGTGPLAEDDSPRSKILERLRALEDDTD
jgi:hypothetical protein